MKTMNLDEYGIWYKSKYHGASSAFTNFVMILSDLIAVMLSFGIGFFLVNLYDIRAINFRSFFMYWPYLPVFILIFQIQALYPGTSLAPSEELRRLFTSSIFAHGGIIFSRYIEDGELDYITIAFIISFSFSAMILLTCRSGFRSLLGKSKIGGIATVVFGAQDMGKMIVNKLLDDRTLGYRPVLMLDDDPATGHEYRGIPIIHDTYAGTEIVKRTGLKMAIVAMSHIKRKDLVHLVNYSASAFRYNILIPDFFGVSTIWMSARDFDGILGLATSQKLKIPVNLFIKRIVDLLSVIFGSIVILPFLLLIGLIVKLSSKGPVLYGHTRIGLNGKEFITYKFRTMVIDADKRLRNILENDSLARKEWDENQKLKNDPRITGFGKFLRKTSLDEFPQLINVLKGEMSLVGPRPIVAAEIEKYGEDFKRIFSVKPGITGLWQVSGRSETNYADRVSFDTYYLQNWSLWMDAWVLYKTIGVVLAGKGAY
ncbi:MAG: undecaprenyl-phosphate galactose phosphotransferase WbaP [Spirochaetaceae bacterium]|jgi:Undecaprenyl-phosphate galactose phosphotransferase WbaP|nr:undecaprenyl-phosphate galactose phosphotransferase WbaP [Spirochaetaceae bacterium]